MLSINHLPIQLHDQPLHYVAKNDTLGSDKEKLRLVSRHPFHRKVTCRHKTEGDGDRLDRATLVAARSNMLPAVRERLSSASDAAAHACGHSTMTVGAMG
jgi:hypothetical protein